MSTVTDRPIAARPLVQPSLDHLRVLEAESIHIFREVVAEFERPVMLYSIVSHSRGGEARVVHFHSGG